MFSALKNCMNVCSGPQELYNSKHMDMNPMRRVCIPYLYPVAMLLLSLCHIALTASALQARALVRIKELAGPSATLGAL